MSQERFFNLLDFFGFSTSSTALMVADLNLGVEGNQGEIKFFQRLILFGDYEEVFPDLGEEAGGSDLGAHKGVAIAHGVKVGKLPARRAMCIFPINFSGTESNTVNRDTLCLTHDLTAPSNLMLEEPAGRANPKQQGYRPFGPVARLIFLNYKPIPRPEEERFIIP